MLIFLTTTGLIFIIIIKSIGKSHPNIHWPITWDIIKDNPYKPWDYNFLSMNPNITFDINPSNPSITLDITKANPEKEWNWYWLTL